VDNHLPTWWEFTIASLAVYRLWRLLAEDDILEPVRRRVLRYVGWKVGDVLPADYRGRWAEFLSCPWCAGAWLSLLATAVWAAVYGWPGVLPFLATWFALSAAVGLIRTNLDPPDE
jgi:hypothetical protein